MKNLIKLMAICCLLVFSGNVIGQEINKLGNGVSRGVLTLKDGKTVKFTNLEIVNDSTISYSADGNVVSQKSTSIFKVVKTGNYAGLYAISCGLGGLLGSLTSMESMNDLGMDGGGYVAMATVGCTVIGALWGLTVKKETIVFKNSAALSFYPTFSTDQYGRYYPMLSVNINLK
jgi:hypothetical protein